MERFTIFKSHYESLKRCTPDVRIEVLDSMLGYAFDGKEPEFKNPMSEAIWIAIRPVVEFSIRQAVNGSKKKPRQIQTESKPNPEEIQTESKSEPKKEVEVEIEVGIENETTSTLKVDYGKVREMWDSICGLKFGKIHKLTESRKQKIRVRAVEMGADYLTTFESIFKAMSQMPFMWGQNNTGWKANFDWIVENDKNYVKVLEGRYKNKQQVEQYGSRRLSERTTEEQFYSQQSQLATAMLLQDGDNGLAGSAQDN